MNTVSVIMPAFNASAFIAESIESVMAQTYTRWELLIVDDGSTDRTAEIVKAYTEKCDKIKYIYQQNGGQGKARNTAIKQASGDLFAFLDSDDVWLPNKLELQIRWMNETNADLVFTNGYFFNEHGAILPRQFNTTGGVWKADEMLSLLVMRNRIAILTVLVKRENLLAVKGFSERPDVQNAEDYNLWMKLCMVNTVFAGIDQRLVKYRIHSKQVSHDRAKMRLKQIMALDDLSYNRECYRACRKKILAYHNLRGFTNLELIRKYFFHPSFFHLRIALSRIWRMRRLVAAPVALQTQKKPAETHVHQVLKH